MSDETRQIANPYADDPIHGPAWAGCLFWCAGSEDVLEQYRADTGDTYELGRSGMERMIDNATGADFAFACRFAEWVTAHVYGAPEEVLAPAAGRAPLQLID